MSIKPIIPCFTATEEEPENLACTKEDIEYEAAIWACRQRDGLDEDEQQKLTQWLAATPVHAQAFHDMTNMLQEIRTLPADMVNQLKRNLADTKPDNTTSTIIPLHLRPKTQNHLWWPGTAMAASLATAAMLWHYWEQPQFSQQYISGAHALNVTMPDGSLVTLDAASKIAVNYYRDRREIHLDEGQAYFSVHHDRERPFDVMAKHTHIRVLGTRFTVRYVKEGISAGQVGVMVEQGKVAVSSTQPAPAKTAYLHAGQAINAQTSGQLQTIHPVSSGKIASWKSGRIPLENITLGELAAELKRYGYPLQVSQKASALRIGGSLQLSQTSTFINALPTMLPVKIIRSGKQLSIEHRS